MSGEGSLKAGQERAHASGSGADENMARDGARLYHLLQLGMPATGLRVPIDGIQQSHSWATGKGTRTEGAGTDAPASLFAVSESHQMAPRKVVRLGGFNASPLQSKAQIRAVFQAARCHP